MSLLAHRMRRVVDGRADVTYDTFNPALLGGQGTLSGGNLILEKTSAAIQNYYASCTGTIKIIGKVYYEMEHTKGASPAIGAHIGFCDGANDLGSDGIFITAGDNGYSIYTNANDVYHDSAVVDNYAGDSLNERIGIAIDRDNSLLWVRDSTGWLTSGDPALTTGGVDISDYLATDMYVAAAPQRQNDKATYYPNPAGFNYSVPSGFKEGVYE